MHKAETLDSAVLTQSHQRILVQLVQDRLDGDISLQALTDAQCTASRGDTSGRASMSFHSVRLRRRLFHVARRAAQPHAPRAHTPATSLLLARLC